MQNGTSNGFSTQHERVTPEIDAQARASVDGDTQTDSTRTALTPIEVKYEEIENENFEGPPSKKRKLVELNNSRRSISRPISPPWKRIGVDGPTSFVEGGRRKSSRTNALPLELQPHSAKRQTRAAQKEYVSKAVSNRSSQQASPLLRSSSLPHRKSISGKAPSISTNTTSPRRESARQANSRLSASKLSHGSPVTNKNNTNTRPRSSSRRSYDANASMNGGSPRETRRQHLSTSTFSSSVANRDALKYGEKPNREDDEAGRSPYGHQSLPRLRFKVKMPSTTVQHPSHILPPRKYTSFREWIESGDATVGDGTHLSQEQAMEEADKRVRVLEAGEPGGLLTPQVCSACLPEPQDEPSQQYSHHDHLVAHALFFRKLLDQEHKRHRNTARLFAQWCADAWRKRNKRPEDILKEQQEEIKGRRRQVMKDLQKQFDLVRAEVDRIRLARWEEERKAQDQKALDRAIKQSTMLFEKRRQEILGEVDSEMDRTSDDDQLEESSESDSESNMSSSESVSDSEEGIDDDEMLTAEELRRKYANLPDTDFGQDSGPASRSVTGSPFPEESVLDDSASRNPNQALDEVDPILLDDSDESTDMDDDMGDSDGGELGEDDDVDDESNASEDSDDSPGLLGFFSSKEIEQNGTVSPADKVAEDDGFEGEDEVSLVPTGPLDPDTPRQDSEISKMIDEHDSENNLIPGESETTEQQVNAEQSLSSEDGFAEAPQESRQSGDASSQESPRTVATKPSDPDSISSYEAPMEHSSEGPDPTHPVALKTPIPHLLRGTLREYQHYGLDWLAGLYTNHINGILADEMGLGKTIQTIALLAHLAVEHEVWGPHLVVVPTSVILNWEMEFKKWAPGFKIMTYYGNQEERKQKRRGWTDDSSWDVLITSYQLVLQDQQVLKRRAWHYMVLDEAHNIKNFRSQRWQALLTFRTRARLLLTGTPLQNNLTELWSLLFFLMPSDGDEEGAEGFADLRNFSEWFRRPVEQILEHGRETMDDEARQVVTKLHTVLRPYLLRRLKADVEKQMPAKYEHVVHCRLSKRQRYLYDGFMSRAQTKETLASGNYLSIINCLMQLRKVCNHPDLFETRPISTSFVMPKSVATEYQIKELLVRKRLLHQHPLDFLDLHFLNFIPTSRENLSRRLVEDSTRIMAIGPLKLLRERQYGRTNWLMEFNGASVQSTLDSMENTFRKRRMAELESTLYFESKRHGRRPIYGKSLIEFLTIDNLRGAMSPAPLRNRAMSDWLSSRSSVLASMIHSVEERARAMDGYIQRFACITPAVMALGVTEATLTPLESRTLSKDQRLPAFDPFHEAQMRLSIAFPDKRLLQYDCGKLQRLDRLLRDLQAGGHRALIFTQMTKMLDILEQFLNIHGHRYLRLDGTTKVEQRQMLTERFNNDNRILAFILSTRSGGLGINLTGADTVIFYDLDWNPAMDKQCQDRCHRIGQTRDVHIYRFVSEYTIESNILRKANQKRMLDDVVIQEGEFTTDYFTKLDVRDMIGDDILDRRDEASKAMDRVLDTRSGKASRVFEQAEDKEDIDAAKNAEKELEHADDGDFEERSVSRGTPSQLDPSRADTPMTGIGDAASHGADLAVSPQVHNVEDEIDTESAVGHIDDYLLRFTEWLLKDQPVLLPVDKSKKRSKKGKEHRIKRTHR